MNIVQKCQEFGYNDVGIDILAAITVVTAVHSATQRTQDYVASQHQHQPDIQDDTPEEQTEFGQDSKEEIYYIERPNETSEN